MSSKLLILAAAAGILAAGCGKKESAPTVAAPAAPEAPETAGPAPADATAAAPVEAGAPAPAEQVLELSGDDTMKYSRERMEVVAGQPIRLRFANKGKLPKAAMGHNFVLLKPGVNIPAFATAAVQAGEAKGFFPADLADQTLAHTKLLGPGETTEITFTVTEPGEYQYICSFPAHFALMKGILIVK